MKKILTIFFVFAAFITAEAQTSREEARRVIFGNGNRTDQRDRDNRTTYPTNNSSREAEIQHVNREVDERIWEVRNNPRYTASEKQRLINQLERERRDRIKVINNRYKYDSNYDKDKRDRDDRYGRKDNGKHLGWEKGKGNPHKNGKKDWKKNQKNKNNNKGKW